MTLDRFVALVLSPEFQLIMLLFAAYFVSMGFWAQPETKDTLNGVALKLMIVAAICWLVGHWPDG